MIQRDIVKRLEAKKNLYSVILLLSLSFLLSPSLLIFLPLLRLSTSEGEENKFIAKQQKSK